MEYIHVVWSESQRVVIIVQKVVYKVPGIGSYTPRYFDAMMFDFIASPSAIH
jgi:hypothetical protein